MKKSFLVSLLLLSNISFGVTVEKDGISIEYEKCLRYKTAKFEWPYCIKITNLSTNPIVIDSSLISVPLVSQDKIANILSKNINVLMTLSLLVSAGTGLTSYFLFKVAEGSDRLRSAIEAAPNWQGDIENERIYAWPLLGISALSGLLTI